MAVKTLYLTNTLTNGWQTLSETPPTAGLTSPATGWTVAKVAATNYASFDSGVKTSSASFSATVQPDGTLDTTLKDAWVIGPLMGTFDATSWTLSGTVRATTASSQAGRLRFRVFKSAAIDGSGTTELTSGVQIGSTTSALSTTVSATSSVTWSPGSTITLNNEYLYIQTAWEITTASGSNNGDVVFYLGSADITTPNFTQVITLGITSNLVQGSVGVLTPQVLGNVAISGVTSTASVGSLSPQISKTISGNTLSGAPGTLAPSSSLTLSGIQLAGTVGSVGKSLTIGITGSNITGTVGSVTYTFIGYDRAITTATGSGTVGSLGSSRTVGLSGNSATATSQSLDTSEQVSRAISTNQGTGSVGSVGKSITKALTGVSASGAVGSVVFTPLVLVSITGNYATNAQVGSLGTSRDYFNISSNLQLLSPSTLLDLFEIDLSDQYPSMPDPKVYFHAGTNGLEDSVVWQGNTYARFPIEASGFEYSSTGSLPQPKVKIANISGAVSALVRDYNDLIMAKVTRRRTFVKYLDAINFANGNNLADPTVHFPDEIWYIDRKANETPIFVEFELSAAFDVSGVLLPRRQCIQNMCTWKYRGEGCNWTGGAVATINDVPTTDIAQDVCGKRLSSCKLRWGSNSQLPYGGFPGVGLIK